MTSSLRAGQGRSRTFVIKVMTLTPGMDRPGHVTIPERVRPEQHEIETAHRLAAVGLDVDFNLIVNGYRLKNIDTTIDGNAWEFKSPKGTGASTISNQIGRAKEQGSRRVVIDMARTPRDDAEVLTEMRRRLAGSSWFLEMYHIAHNGTVTQLTRVIKSA